MKGRGSPRKLRLWNTPRILSRRFSFVRLNDSRFSREACREFPSHHLLALGAVTFHKRNHLWHINSRRDYLTSFSVLPAGRCFRSITFFFFATRFYIFSPNVKELRLNFTCKPCRDSHLLPLSVPGPPVGPGCPSDRLLRPLSKLAPTPGDALLFFNGVHISSPSHWCRTNACRAPFSAVSASTQRTEWRWEFVYLLPLCDLQWITPALWRLL